MVLGVLLYDRDDDPPAGAVAHQYWPETLQNNNPTNWSEIHFGDAEFIPETTAPNDSVIVLSSSVEDNTVEDAWMGGGGWCIGCHEGTSEINYGDHQNLFTDSDTALTRFPCFNKSFLRFQLDAIPPGMEIVSATLTQMLTQQGFRPIWRKTVLVRGETPASIIHHPSLSLQKLAQRLK